MKNFLVVTLVAALILGVFAFSGCNKKGETLKIGLGVYTDVETANATQDKNGSAMENSTVAAVLVDGKGRIVKCVVDCTDNTVAYTANGKAIANDSFLTKYEKGDSYNMVLYGGAVQEWYAQANAFCALVSGKTLSEVKALVSSDGNGTDEVIKAGCTIVVLDFVTAIEKAMNQAVISEATAKDTLKLGVFTSQETEDANEDKEGFHRLETTFFVAAFNEKDKIVAARTECVSAEIPFDINGASAFEMDQNVEAKYEKGSDYGMVQYGNAVQEWYAQADTFCKACIGRTVSEVTSLMREDRYGTDSLQKAGCTIAVDGFVRAVSKIK